jgi:hypothetical protein
MTTFWGIGVVRRWIGGFWTGLGRNLNEVGGFDGDFNGFGGGLTWN